MEKLLKKVTMRLPEDIHLETKQAAEINHRPIVWQARHFFMRGLEQWRRERVQMESGERSGQARAIPPQRVPEWTGEERRRA